jgi:hypothetical protein
MLGVWRQARGLGSHTFEGCYPALAAVPCGENRYDDEEIAEATVGSLDTLKTFVANEPTSDNHGRYILPIVVAQHRGGPLTVLDFGGGPCVGLRLIADHVHRFDLSRFTYLFGRNPRAVQSYKAQDHPRSVGPFWRSLICYDRRRYSCGDSRTSLGQCQQCDPIHFGLPCNDCASCRTCAHLFHRVADAIH